jgi:nitroreductase/NAD-dependent dihydropyrimidine dehydrogenase PreA subunit
MAFPITTVIETERCTGCGACVLVCPSQSLTLVDGTATVTGTTSLHCGHCSAACPTRAVTVPGVDPQDLGLSTLTPRHTWLEPGVFDAAALVHLMQSRRSCRLFSDDPVDRAMLEDLVKIGTTAPSATNSQLWRFTVLPHRRAVETLVVEMARFFRRMNALARKRSARLISKLFKKDALGIYYRDMYELVEEELERWDRTGRERLFHGAPAVIIIGSSPGGSCPREDALLACQNMLLAAHAMGLGTCLVGYAVEVLNHDPKIKAAVGISPQEQIHAVIALGKSKEKYERPAGRKKIVPRFFEG